MDRVEKITQEKAFDAMYDDNEARKRMAVLLSQYFGLRIGQLLEIAIKDVWDNRGVKKHLALKYAQQPMPPDLREAIYVWLKKSTKNTNRLEGRWLFQHMFKPEKRISRVQMWRLFDAEDCSLRLKNARKEGTQAQAQQLNRHWKAAVEYMACPLPHTVPEGRTPQQSG